MELVEIFRYLSRGTDVEVTAGIFHQFVHRPVTRQSITQWKKNVGKIRATQDHGVAYCSLRGEVGSVDRDAIAERMNEIRNICVDFEPDDIYNCNETGMYLKELSTHSYTMEEFMSGSKLKRGTSRASILFCVNASGSSLDRAAVVKALRLQVLGERFARGIQPLPEVPITSMKHEHGYMTLDLFIQWLHLLDESLTNKVAFKRHYLEVLDNKSVTKEYATGEKITNGEAWSYIPYAWSHVKALAVRHCFCKVGVLSKAYVDKLEQESMHVKERSPLYPPLADTDASQARRRYVRLIASVMGGDKIQFFLDKNQKDAQDMAEEIKQKVRKKIAKRTKMRAIEKQRD
ncbi:hypothetical protein BGX30_001180 [Mortierella sp. GBA39]|nr:hypothetical protein BGX30_001180 [Mortierella sp. GBA39]